MLHLLRLKSNKTSRRHSQPGVMPISCFSLQLQNLKYFFNGESELEGMLEPVTPTLPQIPEDKRKDFMKELVEEYRKVSPKVSRENGECDIWASQNLVVVLRKKK